jgi:hypothetical protein
VRSGDFELDDRIIVGGGGGGGGYYGGGGGGGGLGGGGGGSSFGPSGVVFDSGVQSGNGLVTITYPDPAANDAPVNTVPGAQSTNEGTALTFNSANSNLISISDGDAGTSPVEVTLGVSHGKLTLEGDTSGLTFAAGSSNGTSDMTFTGTIASINSALSELRFDPDANYNGSDTLTITTDDQGNTGSGGAKSDTDTVSITVTPENDAPTVAVAAGGSCGTNGRSGTINLTVEDPDGPEGSLTLSATSSRTALVPTSNVTFGGTEAARTLTATAVSGKTGTALLTATVSDGQGSGTVTVNVQVGGNGVDNLTGTPGSDMIFARGAKDTASGQAANDLLCGGDGNDTLSGDAGRDTMTGGAGADRFQGGPGTDTVTDFKAAEGDTKDNTTP